MDECFLRPSSPGTRTVFPSTLSHYKQIFETELLRQIPFPIPRRSLICHCQILLSQFSFDIIKKTVKFSPCLYLFLSTSMEIVRTVGWLGSNSSEAAAQTSRLRSIISSSVGALTGKKNITVLLSYGVFSPSLYPRSLCVSLTVSTSFLTHFFLAVAESIR
ncbi:hypothetical protein TNIN_499901 [Trichonephila inaurata madagascariensis]|uniref:Uncharacterized protein n=1 Tax=Trichonephila inaurata madagascariensis TaxID=2747483 RepID=A0A8X7CQE5_9ARAC|nr:hypothetical protein TNIN_499901 [Trichonephila inaurata madagascariensis]